MSLLLQMASHLLLGKVSILLRIQKFKYRLLPKQTTANATKEDERAR